MPIDSPAAAKYWPVQPPSFTSAMVFPASFEGAPKEHAPNAGSILVDDVGVSVPDDWERVRPSWRRALEFSVALAHTTVVGAVPDSIYAERLQSCAGINAAGEIRGPVCPMRREYQGVGYCGACGCGATVVARLDSKLRYQSLNCPLAKKGFANHVQPST